LIPTPGHTAWTGTLPVIRIGSASGWTTTTGSHGVEDEEHGGDWLNPSPAWDIDVDAGAARVDADFRSLAVERLRLSSGASTIKVQLGSRVEECTVALETGRLLGPHLCAGVGGMRRAD